MNSLLLSKIGIWLFFASFIISIFSSGKNLRKLLIALFVAAVFTLITAFLIQWGASYKAGIGHIPISDAYESFFAFVMFIGIVTSLLTLKIGIKRYLLGGVGILNAAVLGYITFFTNFPKSIEPLNPALQSNWLTWHVLVSFLSYAGFGISAIAALIFLVRIHERDAETWSDISVWGIMFGFPLLAAGIILGSIWAHYAWGTYWGWDPKEVWSLITLLVYAVYIHLRRSGKSQKILAIVSLIGFVSVIITYIGVNFFLSGLHSYGSA